MTSFAVESWMWYGVAIVMLIGRYIVRVLHFKSVLRLQFEDWLMLFLACLYTILIVFLNIDLKVSTNLIDPAHPVVLTPEEIDKRTWGSKTILLVEQCMCAIQWGTKTCLLLLYWRITQNLKQHVAVKITATFVGVTYGVMIILYFGVWCRPFHDYWATPTDNVQCTTALNHLITNLAFNLTSDIMIMSIPLPMLLKARLGIKKKLLLVCLFSLGFFTMLCAILSKVSSFRSPYSSEWVFWYCREASTAMIVTNMPYSWTLIRRIFNLRSFFGDSETDRLHGGQMNEYHPSFGGIQRARDPDLPARSSVHQKRDKFSWSKISSHKKSGGGGDPVQASHDDLQAPPNQNETTDAAHPASSYSGIPGPVQKPSQVSRNDWTLDRLYPLDDEDSDLPELPGPAQDGREGEFDEKLELKG